MISIIFLTVIITCGVLKAQTDTSGIIKIEDFTIKAIVENNVGGKMKTFTTIYKSLDIVTVRVDTFLFRSERDNKDYMIRGEDVSSISVRDGSYILPAAGYSALGGFGLGFVIGLVSNPKGESIKGGPISGLVLGAGTGLLFGLLGAVFGAITPRYKEINLNKYSKENNYERIKKIIAAHKRK